MRILLSTMRDPGQIGGTSTHIAMLSGGLEELGHEVCPLYLGATVPGLARVAGLVWPAGALNRMRSGWGMMYAAEARARLLASATSREVRRAEHAGAPWEVLNAQEVYAVPYLREVADSHGVPLVLTLHGYPLYESVSEGYSSGSKMGRHYLMRTEMRALRLADAVVTVDTRLYRHALNLVPERADRVYTLMNFVDTSRFAPSADPDEERALRRRLRKAWDIPDDKTVLFCPRRLVKKNGVIYPSLAMATMNETDRDRFLLLHAGEGGERGEMERIIRENHLEGVVRLLGGQGPENIHDLYRVADIVLVPSVHSENVEEATSLSALEAMASGRPLIAGNVGGLAEIVVDGETGLLIPADEKALAAAILRLAAAPDLRARLAAAAREYVVERHSHLRAAAAYVEVYRRSRSDHSVSGVGARSKEPENTRSGVAGPPVAGLPDTAEGPADPLAGAQPAGTLPPAWQSISVLGFPLDIVTVEQAAGWVIERAASPEPYVGGMAVVVSFNPELVMRALRDPAAAEALSAADLTYPDGVGAVWAAGRQGARQTTGGGAAGAEGPLERVPGIELAERVLQLAAGQDLPVFFLGSSEGVAEEAARRQIERFPGLRVVGIRNGYFSTADEDGLVREIDESGARVLLVAMGAPRQEMFLQKHRQRLGVRVGLGIGGSFDVWAGKVKRAPAWTRRAKIEWLYRLASDPRRLRRQLVLPRYAAQVVRWSPDDYGPPRRKRTPGITLGRSGDRSDARGIGGGL